MNAVENIKSVLKSEIVKSHLTHKQTVDFLFSSYAVFLAILEYPKQPCSYVFSWFRDASEQILKELYEKED